MQALCFSTWGGQSKTKIVIPSGRGGHKPCIFRGSEVAGLQMSGPLLLGGLNCNPYSMAVFGNST